MSEQIPHNYEPTQESKDLMRSIEYEAERKAMGQFHRPDEKSQPSNPDKWHKDYKASLPDSSGEVHFEAGIPLETVIPESERKEKVNKLIEIKLENKRGNAKKLLDEAKKNLN